MRALGYSWHPQTVGEVEKGNRRVTAEEILGLALALETTVIGLLSPVQDDKLVKLPSGEELDVRAVHELIWAGSGPAISWDGDAPRIPGDGPPNRDDLDPYPPPPRIRR